MALRDDYSQTFANPDGSFSLDWYVEPQRTQLADGTWAPLDSTLQADGDGRVAPVASVSGVSFSGGGDGSDAVTVSRDGESLTFGWPTALPQPTLSGDTATYADIVPGIDLNLTATIDGFEELLVVKTPTAASNPLLADLHFAASSQGLALRTSSGDGLLALDSEGNAVFTGPPGLMWDSSGSALHSQVRGGSTTGIGPSDGGGPGGNAQTAPVDFTVDNNGDGVTVTPDADFLTDPGTTFPVYIDPGVGIDVTAWTMLAHDSQGNTWQDWKFTGDAGVGYCGDGCYNSGPDQRPYPYLKRLYFQFNEHNKLTGTKITDATFTAHESWAYSCQASDIVLARSNSISSSTSWPGPSGGFLQHLDTRHVAYGRDGCSLDGADVEFNSSDLDSVVQHYANGDYGSLLTFVLHAGDESDKYGWKRFVGNSGHLRVTYIPKPGTAKGQVSWSSTDFSCQTKRSDAGISASVTPTFKSTTVVQVPRPGEDAAMRAEFILDKWNGSQFVQAQPNHDQYYAPPAGDVVGENHSVSTTLANPLDEDNADGNKIMYRMRVRSDSESAAGAGDWITGPWSDFCFFTIDTTGPNPPKISGDPYLEENANQSNASGGPGIPGTFEITGGGSVTGLKYEVEDPEGHVVCLKEGTNCQSGWTDYHAGNDWTVHYTPGLEGQWKIIAVAKDALNRPSTATTYPFIVAAPGPEVGLWHATDADSAGKDSSTNGTRHALTLHGAVWDERGRLGVAGDGSTDGSLALDGSSDYADTDAPTLITTSSFTVSAQAFLTDDSHDATVVSQSDRDSGSGYNLYYSTSHQAWAFSWHWLDGSTTHAVRIYSTTTPPAAKVWTHLAGVVNTDTKQMFLYVNGRCAQALDADGNCTGASLVGTGQPTAAAGPMDLGRSWLIGQGAYGNYLPGLVDEVHVWQHAATDAEVRLYAQEVLGPDFDDPTAVALVGRWDAGADGGADGTDALVDLSPYDRGKMDLAGSASLDPDAGVVTLGASGSMATAGPLVDETGSFTIDVQVQPDVAFLAGKGAQYDARLIGETDAAGSDNPNWAIWFHTTSATQSPDEVDGYFVFGRWDPASGKWIKVQPDDGTTITLDDSTTYWLTAVHDAQADGGAGDMRLFVNQEKTLSDTQPPTAWQGFGDVTVGMSPTGAGGDGFFGGYVRQVRLWAGAMTDSQAEQPPNL